MIVEVYDPQYCKANPLLDITPPTPDEFELRVIVWEIQNCPAYDALTDMTDIYCKGFCTSTNQTKETDVHFRAKHGKGSFNWRMVWPVTLPKEKSVDYIWPRLTLQVWDKDLLAPDDGIGERIIGLEELCRRALATGKRTALTWDGHQDFFLKKLKMPTASKESKKGMPKMKVRIELVCRYLYIYIYIWYIFM